MGVGHFGKYVINRSNPTGRISISDIVRDFNNKSPKAIAVLIDNLIQKGYIEKIDSTTFCLTEKGIKFGAKYR